MLSLRVEHGSGDAAELAFDSVVARRLWYAREQPGSVGVTRVLEQLPHRRLLDDLAGIHNGDPVGDPRDHSKVVADEQDARVDTVLQLDDQVQDGGLGGHIESGRRLVHYQQMWVAGQRHGDDNSLLLSAAELVRVAPADTVRVGKADALEQLHAPGPCGVGVDIQVPQQHLFDLRADPHRRVERGNGVLVHHSDAVAPQLHELRRRQRRDVDTLESHGPFDLGRPWQVAHHRECHGRLAAAGLANQSHHLAPRDFQGCIPDRAERAVWTVEGHCKVFDLHERSVLLKRLGHWLSVSGLRQVLRLANAVRKQVDTDHQ